MVRQLLPGSGVRNRASPDTQRAGVGESVCLAPPESDLGQPGPGQGLGPLFPPDLQMPKALSKARLLLRRAVCVEQNANTVTDFHALFDKNGCVCFEQLLHEVDTMAGADMIFPISIDGQPRIVLVQAKAQEKPSLLEMLKTSALAWQFVNKPEFDRVCQASRDKPWACLSA